MKSNVKKKIMLKNVISIFEYPQGEIFKIINKNRKLLDSLQKNMEITIKFPYVKNWLESQDIFLMELVLVVKEDIKIPWCNHNIEKYYGQTWKNINKNPSQDKLINIITICLYSEKGIFKRIDENRQFFELIEKEMPQLIVKYPCIKKNVLSLDAFFNKIVYMLHLEDDPSLLPYRRKWPINN